MMLSVVPPGVAAFAAAHHAAGGIISTAGAVDSQAMLAAAAAALGPVGASYLAAYAPAQANNLGATLLLGQVHTAIGDATAAANTSFAATDNL